MARVRRTPRYPLGTRVSKYFEGFSDPFIGMVDHFVNESGFYHITYDDGDSEEMTEEDLESHYLDDAGANGGNDRRQKPVKTKITTKPKTKTLVLSGTPPNNTASVEDDDDNMADTETQGDEDGDDDNGGADGDVVSHLVQQKVCKAETQADGSEVIVHGTVLAYFPATKTYRVMYTNGTTDDLTFREVVDSMPVTPPTVSAKKKRKPLDDSTPSVSPKKHKAVEKEKRASPPPADENVNSGNGDVAPKSELVDEKDFVWNRSRAYDLLRETLVNLCSTNEATTSQKLPNTVEVLKRGAMKPKKSLELFVENGGLKTLEELLSQWSTAKEKEAGVMVILKILSVIPGVTTDAVRESRIGFTLNLIRKAKGLKDVNPIVKELAGWIITKWKAELVGDTSKSKTEEKSTKDSDARSSTSKLSDRSKSNNGNGSEGDSSSKASQEGVPSHKRSKSVSHLRDLIGGGARPVRPNMNPFGNLLSSARLGSRPLGAAHARLPRRSTVLLDSIANRVSKNSEAEKSAPSTPSSRVAEVWTASRVKFGGSMILEFEKDQEVTRLLPPDSAQPSPKTGTSLSSAKIHDAKRQPKKSILRVKLGDMEREAIAAEAKAVEFLAEEAERHEQAMVAVQRASRKTSEAMVVENLAVVFNGDEAREEGVPPSRDQPMDAVEVLARNADGEKEEGEEEEGEVAVSMPPLSPPRKRDISEDGEDLTDLLPSPDDLMLDPTPPPPPESPPPEEAVNGMT